MKNMKELGERLSRYLALALKLPSNYFINKFHLNEPTELFRIFHYPLLPSHIPMSLYSQQNECQHQVSNTHNTICHVSSNFWGEISTVLVSSLYILLYLSSLFSHFFLLFVLRIYRLAISAVACFVATLARWCFTLHVCNHQDQNRLRDTGESVGQSLTRY